MKLTANTELRLAPEVTVHVRGSEVEARTSQGSVRTDTTVLALLHVFRHPMRLRDALEQLPEIEFVPLTALVLRLLEAGVLLADADTHELLGVGRGFDVAQIHIAMLDDHARTDLYTRAIRNTVQAGDVVVDVGTGTGVLAIAAAQAGAARVYAIERGAIADTAARMFEQNGVADRVTLLRGVSTAVDLPERADVMVSEIIGNEPLGERALEYTRDAVKRFMKPNARFVPGRVRVLACGIRTDPALLRKYAFTEPLVDAWTEAYGMDFSPLVESHTETFFARPVELRPHAEVMTSTVELALVDFTDPPLAVDERRTVTVHQGGDVHAIVCWCELDLDQDHTLDCSPFTADDTSHWKCPVWLLAKPRLVAADETIALRYHRALGRARLEVL